MMQVHSRRLSCGCYSQKQPATLFGTYTLLTNTENEKRMEQLYLQTPRNN